MKRTGTDPETGYSVWTFEPGDIVEGMRIETRAGEYMTAKRCGPVRVLCHSWPEDVAIMYADIKDIHYTDHVQALRDAIDAAHRIAIAEA